MPFQALPEPCLLLRFFGSRFASGFEGSARSADWLETAGRNADIDKASARTTSEFDQAALFSGSDVHPDCRNVCKSSSFLSAAVARNFRDVAYRQQVMR